MSYSSTRLASRLLASVASDTPCDPLARMTVSELSEVIVGVV